MLKTADFFQPVQPSRSQIGAGAAGKPAYQLIKMTLTRGFIGETTKNNTILIF